jgi:hypothetical protein
MESRRLSSGENIERHLDVIVRTGLSNFDVYALLLVTARLGVVKSV